MASPIYSSPLLLGLALRAKYGRFYDLRLKRVAEEVPDASRVVDLCSGDSAIYFRHLSLKRVDYLGVEINPRMARMVGGRGVNVVAADVRTYRLPPCDVMLCLASLYQFSEKVSELIRSAQEVARKIVFLEPVENLAVSTNPLVASFAAWLTDFGEGPVSFRFGEEELRKMWRKSGFQTIERVGPELLGIWSRPDASHW